MGDRVTVYLTLHGKVTKTQAEELLGHLEGYSFTNNHTGEPPTIETLGEHLSADEVNYGSINNVVSYCAEHGIAYDYHHEAGGGYGAFTYRFDGEKADEASYHEGEAMVPFSRILETETLASGLGNLIEEARFWNKTLPDLEVVG